MDYMFIGINQNADYVVYLKPNDFITNQYIEKDQTYITKLVDYIAFNFEYEFHASQKAKISYQYDIIATLYIDYQTTNQNLLKKDYEIIKNKYLNLEQENTMKIKEKINLPYADYYQEVKRFKEEFNLPVKAYLKIEFIVHTNILPEGMKEPVTKTSIEQSQIELAESVFTISQQSNTQNQSYHIKQNYQNEYWISFYSILSLSAFVYLVIHIRNNVIVKQNISRIQLDRTLKRYSNIIIELETMVPIDDYKIIKVKNFDELLDVEEEIREPILFYETEEIAIFTILDHKIAYQYEMKNDFEK